MPFKIVIVGGSITGLTLAAILERYGIDYTLLEKHDDVAPSIGASFGLLAHASRVLDQLGCLDELLPFGASVQNMEMYGPDGTFLGAHARLGKHLDTIVARVKSLEEGVEVETRDGRLFTGSIVVGADGVHSMTRDEMWRIAESDKCDTVSDRKAIRSLCSCMFGISYGLPQVKTETWKHVRQDRHYLCSGAPNGLTFWFLFFKTRKHADAWDDLRYTEHEREQYAAECWTDQVRPDLTFGQMYLAAKRTALVPVEEFVLKRYYHKRVLLLGDSAHKMHPVTGQGGNAGIEDSTFLANRIKDVLQNNPTPTNSQLRDIFQELQDERRPRTAMLTHGARGLAQMESFSSPLLKLVMLHMLPKVPGENIVAAIAESVTQGEPLKYLPLPARSKRLLPYDDEAYVTPKYRSTKASYTWIALFMLIGLLRFIIPTNAADGLLSFGPTRPEDPLVSSPWKSYIDASYFAVNAFWTIESYRSAFSLGPILTPIPWILLAQSFGWEIALPFYCSFWILGSSFQGFYHPWPRAILPAAAQALPIALATAGPNPTLGSDFLSGVPLLSRFNTLTLAHLLVPVMTTIIDTGITHFHGLRWEPVYQFGDHDMKYITPFFFVGVIYTGIGHAPFILQDIIPAVQQGYGPLLLRTPEAVSFGTFTVLIAAWLLFTAWDLRRVNVVNLTLRAAAAYILLGILLAGPGATLMGAWWWREKAWERSRQRRSEDRYADANVNELS
ncbi:hypothetical protein BJX76DRAFT_363710 [Aspergillus varians]